MNGFTSRLVLSQGFIAVILPPWVSNRAFYRSGHKPREERRNPGLDFTQNWLYKRLGMKIEKLLMLTKHLTRLSQCKSLQDQAAAYPNDTYTNDDDVI